MHAKGYLVFRFETTRLLYLKHDGLENYAKADSEERLVFSFIISLLNNENKLFDMKYIDNENE